MTLNEADKYRVTAPHPGYGAWGPLLEPDLGGELDSRRLLAGLTTCRDDFWVQLQQTQAGIWVCQLLASETSSEDLKHHLSGGKAAVGEECGPATYSLVHLRIHTWFWKHPKKDVFIT